MDMAKRVEHIKKEMAGNVYILEEIDEIMEREKYYPIEVEDDDDEDDNTNSDQGIFKYTNNRSQLWVKYTGDDEGSYLIEDVTLRTKKCGNTTVHAFRDANDIKKMMDYFRDNEKYDEFLIFMLGMLLARRIGDILSLKWSDFYSENGNKKKILNTLIEQKTDKIIDISISEVTWKYVDWYCELKNVNPLERLNRDIFIGVPHGIYKNPNKKYSKKEYNSIIRRQAASFRYEFKIAASINGIEYVSTHSLRKSFGYIAHNIYRFDPDNLFVLQTIFGHSSIETTKRYTDIIAEKGENTFNAVAQFISDVDEGKTPIIENIFAIAMRMENFRDVIIMAYRKGIESVGKGTNTEMDDLNEILSFAEKLRL